MHPSTLRSLRRLHHYIGVFLAPAILFFSLTGFIQVLGWQDQRNPAPPRWVSWVASIHQKQAAPKPRAPQPARPTAMPAAPASGGHDEHDESFPPLKIFALLTAAGLAITTMIGLSIALGTRAMRRKSLIMLAAGVVVPVLLMVV